LLRGPIAWKASRIFDVVDITFCIHVVVDVRCYRMLLLRLSCVSYDGVECAAECIRNVGVCRLIVCHFGVRLSVVAVEVQPRIPAAII